MNDGVVSGDLTVGDIDSFVFDANAGEAAHIRVVDTNGDSFTPVVHLYNPDGTLNRVASARRRRWSSTATPRRALAG